MPYKIRKVRGKHCYSVKKSKTKKRAAKSKTKSRTFARCTTMKKAKAQIRLLNYLEHK